MKLLILTQKVDRKDSILGFFYGWIKEFAKHFDGTIVICLYLGIIESDYPANVLSLGKEKRRSKFLYLLNFYKYIWKYRKEYQAVFVHMNQLYVILGYPIWKLLNKKIYLWYAHGSVSLSLRLAHLLADGVITSTKEGFRIGSKKIKIVGQGIDVKKIDFNNKNNHSEIIKIVSVGRISPVKKYEVIIQAISKLKRNGYNIKLKIAGGADTKDQILYKNKLNNLISEKGLQNHVRFVGAIENYKIGEFLNSGDIFVNASLTGSLDKSGLEAIVSGLPVFTCNESYFDIFNEDKDVFCFKKGDHFDLSIKISKYLNLDQEKKSKMINNLHKTVMEQHSLEKLAMKISKIIKS